MADLSVRAAPKAEVVARAGMRVFLRWGSQGRFRGRVTAVRTLSSVCCCNICATSVRLRLPRVAGLTECVLLAVMRADYRRAVHCAIR